MLAAQSLGQTQFTTLEENFDGQARDIAAQKSAVGIAGPRRAWVAQGRLRAAFALNGAVRMLGEDRYFPNAQTQPYEQPIALEVDDVKRRLWTLTDKAIYVESFASPSYSPANLSAPQRYDLDDPPNATSLLHPVDTGAGWNGELDELRDLKLSPLNDDRVFVLTSKRILIFQVVASPPTPAEWLAFEGSADELFDRGPSGPSAYLQPPDTTYYHEIDVQGTVAGNASSAALKITEFQRLRVINDTSSTPARLMAFVTADMGAYLSIVGVKRPPPLCTLACWLDKSTYTAPTFYTDAGSVVLLNTIREQPGDTGLIAAYVIGFQTNGHDVFADTSDGGKIKVAAACGVSAQLRIADATGCFDPSSANYEKIDWDNVQRPVDFVDPGPKNELQDVFVDRHTARQLYVLSPRGFWIYNWTGTPTANLLLNEPIRKGVPRDMAQVRWSLTSDIYTLWLAATGTTDHCGKVIDVTTDEPELKFEFYNMSSADGGVALGDTTRTDVYLPTLGGVVRYEYHAASQSFRAVPSSYVSAEIVNGDGEVDTTEHIDLAYLPNELRPYRLLTASTRGDFMEFEVNAAFNPDRPERWFPDGNLGMNATDWPYVHNYDVSQLGGYYYGNDVAFLDLGESQWVLCDVTPTLVPPSGCHATNRCTRVALLGYRWDGDNDEWVHEVSAAMDEREDIGNANQLGLSTTITITKDERWALVASGIGVSVFDISGLDDGTPTIAHVETYCVSPDPQDCDSNYSVFGLAHVRGSACATAPPPPDPTPPYGASRVFAWVNNETTGGHILVYGFNESNGTLTHVATIPPSGPGLGHSYRARTIEIDDCASDIFFAGVGSVTRVRWNATNPNALTTTGVWQSQEISELQDCRVFSLPQVNPDGASMLAVKNTEGFGFIDPAE